MGLLDGWFQLRARGTNVGTEVRAGLTTFMVMAYIIIVYTTILEYIGLRGHARMGLTFRPTLTVTCFTAGVLSIDLCVISYYPFALAPGMGLNAVLTF